MQYREVHGTDGAISLERQKETAMEAVTAFQAIIGQVSQMDNIALHWSQVDAVLNWTKEQLDAFLALADVIIEQCNEPGESCPLLGYLAVCHMGWELYGSIRYTDITF
jgi:hypothetical protein